MGGNADVLIVGGGIIGLAIAREAAGAGLSVILLEKGTPGGETSTAAAGMLGAQIESEGPDPLLDLCLRSRDLYPAFAREVQAESGLDPCLLDEGTIQVASGGVEALGLERQHAFQRSLGLPVERLDRQDLMRLEPALAPGFEAALYLPHDRSIDNALLVRALRLAAGKAGARLHHGAGVRRLLVERGRIVGVEADGGRFTAGAVVIAAGAWSGEIRAEGTGSIPTHPVRGQMICLEPPGRPVRHVVVSTGCYLVPRRDGRLLVGSTMERVGFDSRVTAGGIASLASAAVTTIPVLREAPWHSTWAGLRPATSDDLPAIGAGPAPGLWYACGHLRNGILLAPLTARIVVRLLRGEGAGVEIGPFDPRRLVERPGVTSPFAPSSPAAPGSRL
ncbi:MAG TPA: glycine oxidase ThiO [Candidatus Polarisedimenticolia bacterium]|nr:glycine oxidase ThiO [Candidatus Polarisedimenticolia bacterium]